MRSSRGDEIVGTSFERLLPPEIADEYFATEAAQALTQGRSETEGWRLRKDGSRFFVHVVMTLHEP